MAVTDGIAEPHQPRARQNVMLELGYFIGKLTRARVCTLLAGTLEIPSDWRGVIDEPFDASGAWKQTLARELQAAGYHRLEQGHAPVIVLAEQLPGRRAKILRLTTLYRTLQVVRVVVFPPR